jgi:hypothetical protein
MKDSNTEVETALSPEHLLHLTMARNWLAIGDQEEARREFQSLPRDAQIHPQAEEIRRQLQKATD